MASEVRRHSLCQKNRKGHNDDGCSEHRAAHVATSRTSGRTTAEGQSELATLKKQKETNQLAIIDLQRTVSELLEGLPTSNIGALVALSLQVETAMAAAADAADAAHRDRCHPGSRRSRIIQDD